MKTKMKSDTHLRFHSANRKHPLPSHWIPALAMIACTGLSGAAPLAKTFSEGQVSLVLSIDPPTVNLADDTEVKVELVHPDGVTATIPDDLSDRFEGFTVAGSFSSADVPSGSMKSSTYNYRLTPTPGAKEYKIRPFAVTVVDSSSHPPQTSWFPTQKIEIPASADDGKTPETVSTPLAPRYVRPSFRSVPKIIAVSAGGVAILIGLLYAISKIRLRQKIKRMTPRERALRELSILMERQLPEKGLFKDFYVELTFVVRRYIERRHGIRAPEQTTEEFLAAASKHIGFSRDSLHNIKQFLSAADLVKFAGVSATVTSAAEATGKARAYLEHEDQTIVTEPRKTQEVSR